LLVPLTPLLLFRSAHFTCCFDCKQLLPLEVDDRTDAQRLPLCVEVRVVCFDYLDSTDIAVRFVGFCRFTSRPISCSPSVCCCLSRTTLPLVLRWLRLLSCHPPPPTLSSIPLFPDLFYLPSPSSPPLTLLAHLPTSLPLSIPYHPPPTNYRFECIPSNVCHTLKHDRHHLLPLLCSLVCSALLCQAHPRHSLFCLLLRARCASVLHMCSVCTCVIVVVCLCVSLFLTLLYHCCLVFVCTFLSFTFLCLCLWWWWLGKGEGEEEGGGGRRGREEGRKE
jgi:hypothetical protein